MSKGSVWSKTVEIPKREKLQKNLKTEVAVIGGGMAGILIADRLKSCGKKVVVLEADRIAGGQTKNTTAKITAQHGCIYWDLASRLKDSGAMLYVRANMRAVEWYRKTAAERNIDCDFENKNAYVYSKSDKHKLKMEAETCKRLQLPIEFIEDISLPFETVGAVCMKNQAQFCPLFLTE